MNKRGLSLIITTLILIVLALVAVGIIWFVVKNVISGGTKGIAIGKFIVDAEIKNVDIDNSTNNVSLTVKRKPGIGNISGIKFIFYDGTNSEIITEEITLKELESRRFYFHLINLNVNNLIRISIVPIFKTAAGEETMGNVVDVYDVEDGESIGPPSEPVCGNNIQEGTEVCDGTNLGGEDCISQGFVSGTLSCLGDCSGFDTGGCYTIHGINLSDGFEVGSAGSVQPYGITFDSTDNSFWINDFEDYFVYHFDSSGNNLTDGFDVLGAGSSTPIDITFDTRDNSLWVLDIIDDFIYHFDSSGNNLSGGVSTSGSGADAAYGITFDPRDNSFWLSDAIDDFVYHFDSSGNNLADGFDIRAAGVGTSDGITFDTRDNSFWIVNRADNFIYHFDSSGNNLADGFYIGNVGSIVPYGIALDTRDSTFWVTDTINTFVYHFS